MSARIILTIKEPFAKAPIPPIQYTSLNLFDISRFASLLSLFLISAIANFEQTHPRESKTPPFIHDLDSRTSPSMPVVYPLFRRIIPSLTTLERFICLSQLTYGIRAIRRQGVLRGQVTFSYSCWPLCRSRI